MISVAQLSCLGSGYRSCQLHQDQVLAWHSVCITPHLQAVRKKLLSFYFVRICPKNVKLRAAEKRVSLFGSNLPLYLKSNLKCFMGFITYQRHIPQLYCQRVMLNVSSPPEDLVMDLLPGSKTLRSLQRK